MLIPAQERGMYRQHNTTHTHLALSVRRKTGLFIGGTYDMTFYMT